MWTVSKVRKYFIFKNMRFRTKLFITYVILVVLMACIMGVYAYNQSRAYLLSELCLSKSEALRQIVDGINYRFSLYENAMQYLMYYRPITTTVSQTDATMHDRQLFYMQVLEPQLSTVRYTNSDIRSLSLYTVNAEQYPKRGLVSPLDALQDEDLISIAMTDMQVHWTLRSGELVGVQCYSAGDGQRLSRENANMLVLTIDPVKAFSGELLNQPDYCLQIVSPSSGVLYQTNELKRDVGSLDAYTFETEDAQRYVRVEGERYLVFRDTIEQTGWNAVLAIHESALTIGPNRFFGSAVFLVLATFIGLIGLAALFSALLVNGIDKITAKLVLVERGDLKVSITSDSGDEIGMLTNSIGRMVRSLDEMIERDYKNKIILREAELKALQAQINPHFLYNALSAINWMAIKRRAMDISDVTHSLSTLYRAMLNEGRSTISVKEELDNARRYIDIQCVMHAGGFLTTYDIDARVLHAQIIGMILQPVIENAIEHGIQRRQEEGGCIGISASLEDGSLCFQVSDNGPGIEQKLLDDLLTRPSHGYGLKNVDDRIRIRYGSGYGVRILRTNSSGTCMALYLPVEFDENMSELLS